MESISVYDTYIVRKIRLLGIFPIWIVEICRVRDPDNAGTWRVLAHRLSYASAVKLAAAMTIMNPMSRRIVQGD
jgi:hypothetical protein